MQDELNLLGIGVSHLIFGDYFHIAAQKSLIVQAVFDTLIACAFGKADFVQVQITHELRPRLSQASDINHTCASIIVGSEQVII